MDYKLSISGPHLGRPFMLWFDRQQEVSEEEEAYLLYK